MSRWTVLGCALGLAALVAVPALAADSKDPKKPATAPDKRKGPPLRYAHSYEQAVAEAKERNCVIFVSIHAEH